VFCHWKTDAWGIISLLQRERERERREREKRERGYLDWLLSISKERKA
jgi:hypothetical protein